VKIYKPDNLEIKKYKMEGIPGAYLSVIFRQFNNVDEVEIRNCEEVDIEYAKNASFLTTLNVTDSKVKSL
jgi:hypothetical protein